MNKDENKDKSNRSNILNTFITAEMRFLRRICRTNRSMLLPKRTIYVCSSRTPSVARSAIATLTARRNCDRQQFFSTIAQSPAQATFSHDSNVPQSVRDRIGTNLHCQKDHPLAHVKHRIERWFKEEYDKQSDTPFVCFDDLSPIVTTKANFDALLTPVN